MAVRTRLPQRGTKVSTGEPVIICIEPGAGCYVSLQVAGERSVGPDSVDYFAAPTEKGAFYDPALEALARKLNEALRETNAARTDPAAKLGLLPTSRGYVPIWKYEEPSTAPQLKEGSLQTLSDDMIDTMLWPKT